MRIAAKFVDEQFEVLSDKKVEAYRQQLPEDQRGKFAELIAKAKLRCNGAVRMGHMLWISGVLDGHREEHPVPTFIVPEGRPYKIMEDAALAECTTFLTDVAHGKHVEAYQTLQRAAESGSPLAMVIYGKSLCKGDVPGKGPDHEAGTEWLERAALATNNGTGAADLGLLLLKGEFLPQDLQRGAALLQLAYSSGSPQLEAAEIASIYKLGRYGVHENAGIATLWALEEASPLRQWLARMGLNQSRWVDAVVSRVMRSEKRLADMTPWELNRIHLRLLNGEKE